MLKTSRKNKKIGGNSGFVTRSRGFAIRASTERADLQPDRADLDRADLQSVPNQIARICNPCQIIFPHHCHVIPFAWFSLIKKNYSKFRKSAPLARD